MQVYCVRLNYPGGCFNARRKTEDEARLLAAYLKWAGHHDLLVFKINLKD